MAASEHGTDVFHHVRDSTSFELPQFLGGELHIPQPFGDVFPITRFMLLELVTLVLAVVIFRGLAKRIASGEAPRGRFWHFWEAIVVYLRDQLVRPLIGGEHGGHVEGHLGDPAVDVAHAHGAAHHAPHDARAAHPADRFLPFIWSVFFFVLINNLLGMLPFLGSATGNIWVTGVLAVCTFAYVVWTGSAEQGALGFWKSLVPQMELPAALKPVFIPLLWFIEFAGLLIKHGVLAIRLFANIMAGHTVVSVILGFIAVPAIAGSMLYYPVGWVSVFVQAAVGLLELLVAFIQAYVFAFLATLFIGSAVHPH